MLQRTVSYSTLLRVVGGCFLLYGLYLIVLALTCQIEVGGAIQYSGAMIFEDPMRVENYIFYGRMFPGSPIVPLYGTLNPLGVLNLPGVAAPGPLMWVGLGILCVSLTSTLAIRCMPMSFVGLQLALWMISASMWTPMLWLLGSTQYGLGAVGPLFLVTLALSLILFAFYKPVAHGLSKLTLPQPQV